MKVKKLPRELSPTVRPTELVCDVIQRVLGSPISSVLVVEGSGKFLGVLSSGDILKLLNRGGAASLDQTVGGSLGGKPTSARSLDEALVAMRRMDGRLRYVPIIDYRGRLETVIVERTEALRIGSSLIDSRTYPYVIAEVGLNHNGSLDLAQTLIRGAEDAGAQAVKFQARGTSLYRPGNHYLSEDLSAQYVHRLVESYSLPFSDLALLFQFVREETNLDLICTAWDLEALHFLREARVDAIKIASADFTNHELLSEAVQGSVPVLASTGMSRESEVREGVEIMLDGACDFGLFHCISSYPPDPKDLNLGYMHHLKDLSSGLVGYSSHEMHAVGVVPAVALGARMIERHITTDKSLEGTDHKISSDIQEFGEMCSSIRSTSEMVAGRIPRVPTQGELLNQEALGKSLVAAVSLREGDVVSRDEVSVRSPGRGMRPYLLSRILGRAVQRDVALGEFLHERDFEVRVRGAASELRNFEFSIPWGIPVRYHDYSEMAELFEPNFFEVHLSAADLEYPVSDIPFVKAFPHKFHTPDLFHGDHIIDIANADPAYRQRSIEHLNETFEHIRSVGERIGCAAPLPVIASLGGFTEEIRMTENERSEAENRLEDSLTRLHLDGISLLAQTLPPFPWYLGGRRICNLFVDPLATAALVKRLDLRLCLDIAHTYLSAEFLEMDHSEAWKVLLPLTDHLHVVDAAGESGEGLNIGDGLVDFSCLSDLIKDHAPKTSFIPEVWQGHRNHGDGFRVALERLERIRFCPPRS